MFLMFVILTLCATLVSLFITRGTIYRYTINYFIREKGLSMQLQNGLAITQELITPQQNNSDDQSSDDASAGQSEEEQIAYKVAT